MKRQLIEKDNLNSESLFLTHSVLNHSIFGAVFSPNKSRVRPNRELACRLQIVGLFFYDRVVRERYRGDVIASKADSKDKSGNHFEQIKEATYEGNVQLEVN